MKGMPMIDVACDDALISALMEMDAAAVHQIVERYDRAALGYPTPEKVAQVAAACALTPPWPARRLQPVPRACRPTYTISGRLVGVVWGVVSGVATTLAVGWMTAAPWLERAASWLSNLLSS